MTSPQGWDARWDFWGLLGDVLGRRSVLGIVFGDLRGLMKMSGGPAFSGPKSLAGMPHYPKSDAHKQIHAARPSHGQYCFCMHCWRGREAAIPTDLSEYARRGRELAGCIKVKRSSTWALLKHVRTHGFCMERKRQEVKGDEPWAGKATKDRVHAHVLQDLQPLSSIQ